MRRIINFVLYAIILFLFLFYFQNREALWQQFKYRYLKNGFKAEVEEFKKEPEEKPKEDLIIIPKIAIEAPLVLAKSEDEKDILKSLKNGAVMYPNFSLPAKKGRVVITAHSSGGREAGDYKSLFSLLDKLQKGNKILIYFKGQEYKYKVFETKIINASDYEEVFKEREGSTLVLFTCWPLGTTFKRLVIKARLVK